MSLEQNLTTLEATMSRLEATNARLCGLIESGLANPNNKAAPAAGSSKANGKAAPAPAGPSAEDLATKAREVLLVLAKSNKPAALAILAKYGVAKLSEVAPEHHAAIIKDVAEAGTEAELV